MTAVSDVSGLILAGGQGRRMQQSGQPAIEKGLTLLHDQPLVAWAVNAMPSGLADLYISANRYHDQYDRYGVVVADDPSVGDDLGPLAGVVSVMQRMSTHWLYVAPVDVPRPPVQVFERLLHAVNTRDCDLVYACSDQPQPLFMLLNKNLLDSLRGYLQSGFRQVQRWQRDHGEVVVFDAERARFFNINTPDDLRQAHQLISPAGPDY